MRCTTLALGLGVVIGGGVVVVVEEEDEKVVSALCCPSPEPAESVLSSSSSSRSIHRITRSSLLLLYTIFEKGWNVFESLESCFLFRLCTILVELNREADGTKTEPATVGVVVLVPVLKPTSVPVPIQALLAGEARFESGNWNRIGEEPGEWIG